MIVRKKVERMLEGTLIRPLKKYCDERGYLCELIRSDGDYYYPFTMCYYSVSHKDVIRAWHRHPRTEQRDTFIVIQGMAKVCAYDMETDELNEHFIGEDKNRGGNPLFSSKHGRVDDQWKILARIQGNQRTSCNTTQLSR